VRRKFSEGQEVWVKAIITKGVPDADGEIELKMKLGEDCWDYGSALVVDVVPLQDVSGQPRETAPAAVVERSEIPVCKYPVGTWVALDHVSWEQGPTRIEAARLMWVYDFRWPIGEGAGQLCRNEPESRLDTNWTIVRPKSAASKTGE
jgi:hypothetical protein